MSKSAPNPEPKVASKQEAAAKRRNIHVLNGVVLLFRTHHTTIEIVASQGEVDFGSIFHLEGKEFTE